jgi:hypothetical protein
MSVLANNAADGRGKRRPQLISGRRIRQLERLKRLYGKGRWRKMKGETLIGLASGQVRRAELHWYEAHGVGKRDMKFKQYLD